MKSFIAAAALVVLLAPPAFSQQPSPAPTPELSMIQRASYAIGMDIAAGLKSQSVEVDAEMLARGLKDALTGSAMLLSETEAREAIMSLQAQMQAKAQERQQAQAQKNSAQGAAFLTANKAKEGVVTTPSGLQYKVLRPGTGASPKASDTVTVHYRGTLIDGTEFDSSYERGTPATFPLSGVIPGWTEGLQLMKVGAKHELVLPAALAYGERQPSPQIGPNSVLIFEVELLEVKGAEPPAQQAPTPTP